MSRYRDKTRDALEFERRIVDAAGFLLRMVEESEREIVRLQKLYDKLESEYQDVVDQLTDYQVDVADTIRENGGIVHDR